LLGFFFFLFSVSGLDESLICRIKKASSWPSRSLKLLKI
jgi:hypothetical protein